MDRPQMGRGWHVRARGQSDTGEATREECARKREKVIFLFLGGKIGGRLLCPLGGGRDRGAAIAALGHRHCRENVACAGCGTGWKNPAGGGLWPPSQLIQLIYLRYLCVSTEREKRMDVCFLLTLYI